MEIKRIFDEITSQSGTNAKMAVLNQYRDNELLKRVLYLANSRRVKFYIKQIPTYVTADFNIPLEFALDLLASLSNRTVTGGTAKEHLKDILQNVTADDAYIIERIIEKDCKIGMGVTNINKIMPKLIETTPYMGAKSFKKELVEKLLAKGPAFSDMKMDGRYANAVVRHNSIELESRQGEINHLQGATFLDELEIFPNCVLNGELTMDGISRYESNGIIASLVSILGKEVDGEDIAQEIADFESDKSMTLAHALANIRYTVWDTITIEEYFTKKSITPYHIRRELLRDYITQANASMVSIVDSVEVTTYQEAIDHFQSLIKQGHEGTILKSIDAQWKDGKPAYQIKFKLEIDIDLEIIGFNYGTGKNSDVISSIDCKSVDGLLLTSPTGMKESEMQWVTENQQMLLGKILATKCSGISQDSDGNYSVLHPVFKEIRNDKAVADSLEQIIEIEDMAKGLK